MVNFIETLILGIVLSLPFGPVTFEILRRGLQFGFSASIETVSGAFSAELIYFSIIYLGLVRFVDDFLIKIVLGLLGVGFLFYLGYDSFKNFLEDFFQIKKEDYKLLYGNSFISGFFIAFFSPLSFFMWVGIIGAFLVQSASLFVSSGILVGTFLSFFGVAIASKIGSGFIKRENMMFISLFSSGFLIYFGGKLFYDLVFSLYYP